MKNVILEEPNSLLPKCISDIQHEIEKVQPYAPTPENLQNKANEEMAKQ